jgi:hypothetical protein
MIASVCPQGICPKVRIPESRSSDLQMFPPGLFLKKDAKTGEMCH